jgi:TetR/AcrR family transcriptional regulator, transcriptional repressor for nem operon
MPSKAENTKNYIVQQVAPVFNRHGYMGTSLSDLTNVTGLTKGAIYGNFSNKEELAILAFKQNVKALIAPLAAEMGQHGNAIDKLFALTKYYRGYYNRIKTVGGCPVLNVGVDANNVNTALFHVVKSTARKLEEGLRQVIETGIQKKEIQKQINAAAYARIIYGMIEGSVFMASAQNSKVYIDDMMDMIDTLIREKLSE